jgi:RsiW-degrading membrane proteinase PrsW (M82 family)
MILLFISLLTLLPIIIWAYIFSYIDWDRLNKQRFIIGILAWLVSVLPIIFFEQIFSFLKLSFILKIFQNFNLSWYFLLILIFFIFIITFSYLYSFIFKKSFKIIWKYITSSFLIFILFTLISSLSLYLLDFFGLFTYFSLWKYDIVFSWTSITSLRLVLFYYLFIALIEELSKHSNFLWTSLNYINTIQKWVLYAFFVTLGFVFLENILYIYNVYLNTWFWSDFFLVYFTRSIFSLMLHIFCSALLSYYFLKSYFKYWNIMSIGFIKIFFLGILFAVFWHAFFDISLEFWWTFMMMIYFLFGYFYITSIFYRD